MQRGTWATLVNVSQQAYILKARKTGDGNSISGGHSTVEWKLRVDATMQIRYNCTVMIILLQDMCYAYKTANCHLLAVLFTELTI